MKKRVLVAIIIGILCILSIFLCYEVFSYKKPKEEKKQEEKIEDVVSNKLENLVEKEFILWVHKEYPSALKKLNQELEKEEYNPKMWHKATGYSYFSLLDFYQNKTEDRTVLPLKEENTFSIVGDVSLADNWDIMPKYDERGKGVLGILSEDILTIMRGTDWMIANSEFTVSNRGTKMAGKQYTFRASPERLSIYDEMGVDMVTLANNHVYDYGEEAFLDMLDAFQAKQMPYIGAGRNLQEASKPYYVIIGGYKVAFLNATRAEKYILTPGATEETNGVFRCYDPTNMINQITKAKQESDYVIAIIHYGKEGYHELEEEQVSSSKQYIDAGADMVVGHHAHTLQGIEFYNHKPIIYNLGNFIFNAEVDDTAIFQVKMNQEGIDSYYIYPAIQKNCFTDLLIDEGKQRVINDLNSWSYKTFITPEGQITEIE